MTLLVSTSNISTEGVNLTDRVNDSASINLRGALLGGLLLGIMENYGQALFGTQWRDVVAFVLLVLVLLIKPTGILGESLGRARA
jgi:hypothetical protein